MCVRRKLKILLLTCIFFTLIGCTFNADLKRRIDVIEQGSVDQKPLTSPAKSVSVLRDALACMDQMLTEEQIPTTLIAVKSIPDISGLYSTGTKDMLITALSRMSRSSNAFKVVDYEVDPLRQDTVQTITGLLLSSGSIDLQRPQIYISGSISFGDRTVTSKRSSIGVSTNSTDSGYSWDILASAVGLDLHLGEMKTRTLYPGMDSANELIVAGGGRSVEIGAKATGLPKHIYRVGTQFEVSADNNQGAGAAIRGLVDLAAIELVGKWSRVPYWQCLEYENNHPEFLRQMRQWYDEMSISERISAIQRALTEHRYWQGEISGELDDNLRHSLMLYQSATDLVPSGMVNFETYTRLLSTYVKANSEGKFYRAGWNNKNFEADALPKPETLKPNALRPWSPIALELLGGKGNELTIGDAIVLRVVPPRTGYLYCYYQDATGVISQLYPNPLQRSKIVQGGRGLLIPDISNPNTFLMQASSAGAEEAVCVVSETSLDKQLPEAYTAAKIEPIKTARDLSELKRLLENMKSLQKPAVSEYQWKIKGAVLAQPASVIPETEVKNETQKAAQ